MPHPPHPLASLSQIISTPSRRDGIPKDLEDDLRTVGCQLIQEAGVMLGLPQATMATAQVLVQRFWWVSSLMSFTVNEIAISALYLSSKLTESPLRLRDLLNTHFLLLSRTSHLLSHPSLLLTTPFSSLRSGTSLFDDWSFQVERFPSQAFYDLKEKVVVGEMQILKRLGFNMQVDLPYSYMVNYCKILNLVGVPGFVQACWNILNDSFQTPLPTLHPPPTLATASILLASRLHPYPLPDQWWVLFDTEWDDIWGCCGVVMRLWEDWGLGPGELARGGEGGGEDEVEGILAGDEDEEGEREKKRKERWVRGWRLAGSKRRVKRWVEESSAGGGEGGVQVEGQ